MQNQSSDNGGPLRLEVSIQAQSSWGCICVFLKAIPWTLSTERIGKGCTMAVYFLQVFKLYCHHQEECRMSLRKLPKFDKTLISRETYTLFSFDFSFNFYFYHLLFFERQLKKLYMHGVCKKFFMWLEFKKQTHNPGCRHFLNLQSKVPVLWQHILVRSKQAWMKY